jgi:hypothetical protein
MCHLRGQGRIAKLEGVKGGEILCWGMGKYSRLDGVYIDFGSADGKQPSHYHLGYGLNIE